MNEPVSHKFSKSEIRQAEHEFAEMLKKYFGEITKPLSDGAWRGKSWECRSMVSLDAGLWRLCQQVVHTGSKKIFGKIEVRDTGHMIRFIVFYEPEKI